MQDPQKVKHQSVNQSSVLVTLSHETANLVSEISEFHNTHLDNLRRIFLKFVECEKDLDLDYAASITCSFDLTCKLIQQLPDVKLLATETNEK
jgi:hypothetical protein